MRAENLHVLSCYFNHRRNSHLLKNAREWLKRTLDDGVTVHMAEHQIGERPFELTAEEFPHVHFHHVRGHAAHEVWLKEALIKKLMTLLPDHVKYVCWEDADVEHARRDWAAETIQMLQHHRVGQTWVHAIDMGPSGGVMRNEWGNDVDRSFSAAFIAGDVHSPLGDLLHEGRPRRKRHVPAEGYAPAREEDDGPQIDYRQHYGYSWAARRSTLEGVGLIDWLVTGSADYHMALGYAGIESNVAEDSSHGYRRRIREFQRLCEEHVKQDIGCVPGTIMAHYHGPKANRFYISRHAILTRSGFDPDKDLAYGLDGMPYLTGDNRVLRDGLRRYFSRRNED